MRPRRALLIRSLVVLACAGWAAFKFASGQPVGGFLFTYFAIAALTQPSVLLLGAEEGSRPRAMAYASVAILATFTVAVGATLVGTAMGYGESSVLGRIAGSALLIALLAMGGWMTWYVYNSIQSGRRGATFVPADGFSRLMARASWVDFQIGKSEGDRSREASK